MNVDEFTDFLTNGLVEIYQKFIFLTEKGVQIVSVILEERTLTIRALQGIPMDTPPLVVVTDAKLMGEG